MQLIAHIGADLLTALMGGEVSLSFANIPAIHSHVKSGRLRPLANLGPKRSELMVVKWAEVVKVSGARAD